MKGFTLVEILVSVVIMSAMIIGLLQIFSAGQNVYSSNQALMEKQRIIQQVLGGMVREIRQASAADITVNSSNDQIDFTVPVTIDPIAMSNTISYSLSGDQLIRTHPPGVQAVLATNVDSLTFTLNGDLLEIEIQARVDVNTGDIVFTVQEIVDIRS